MSVFKFFSEEAHARSFMAGRLLLRPLTYYRALEAEEGGRGDRRDGVLTYQLPDGLPLTHLDGRVENFKGSFISVPKQQIFVLCASNQLSADLAGSFGGFCVEFDSEVVTTRLRQRAHRGARFDYDQTVSGSVDYRANHRPPGADWALPERLALTKPDGFAWQDEYRVAVPTRDAFLVENVDLVLHQGEELGRAEPAPPPVMLKVGSLKNHAVLHRLEA